MKLSKSNHQNSAIFQGKEQQTKGDNKFKNLAAWLLVKFFFSCVWSQGGWEEGLVFPMQSMLS